MRLPKPKTQEVSIAKLEDCEWLSRPATQNVFQALSDAGHNVRAVGGCVRNALLGKPVKDVDLATTALPAQTTAAAEAAGLTAIPTGADHGTITVISDHIPHEVTTLRQDVSTDGRRAEVAFTDDWALDASRRDFTINAFYADAKGNVFDPVGGYADLRAGRIRFIGDAEARIREDYLRILRFFRFTAEYGDGNLDEIGLAAAVELKSGLDQLARERIHQEIFALLLAPAASDVAAAMEATGIFDQVFQCHGDVAALLRLIAIEKNLNCKPDAIRRLASLFLHHQSDAARLRDQLKLSNKEFERLNQMSKHNPKTLPNIGYKALHAMLYEYGPQTFQDRLLLAWARSGVSGTDENRTQLFHYARQWQRPEFPLRGDDVLALGIDPGPEVGALLQAVEQWWVERDFKPTRDMAMDKLHERAKVNRVNKT